MRVQEAANATSSGNLHKQEKVQKLHCFACDLIISFELFVSLDCEKSIVRDGLVRSLEQPKKALSILIIST